MEILQIDGSKAPEWDEYVLSNAESTFYHLFGWKNIIEKSFGHRSYYLMAKSGNQVVGILPIVHIKSRLFGSILSSMPFMGIGGICAENEEAAHALLDAADALLKKLKGGYLELRHRKKTNFQIPCKEHKVTMTIELDSDFESIWKQFKSKHRTAIRRSEKNSLKIKSGKSEYLDTFYEIESIGWRDLGTPFYSKYFFKNIFKELGNFIEIFLVFSNGKPIATAFNGLFKDEVEGMWTYSLKEYSKLQTNYFLYWQMIKSACENGYRWYHLGRSTTKSGASFYKAKWNAVPHQLYWEYILNTTNKPPEINTENPKFKYPIRIWKKLPLVVTKKIGPYIAKNIP